MWLVVNLIKSGRSGYEKLCLQELEDSIIGRKACILSFSSTFHLSVSVQRALPMPQPPPPPYTFSLFGYNACIKACQSVSLEAQSSPVPGADTQVWDPVTVPVATPSRAQSISPSDPHVHLLPFTEHSHVTQFFFLVSAFPPVSVYCFSPSLFLFHHLIPEWPRVIDRIQIIRCRVIFNRAHLPSNTT